eukprot:TRINITY_DN209_c2_g1_i5.p1 TRINITY_DN209_c2_g1~~TRINITY_DN209_c2_g1_i5.p1  ORF type:complete len:177 (-),score=6.69 TRINITY_DN209_c2_g1_i5:220-750(-)
MAGLAGLIGELKQLAELRSQGVLTDEEFAQLKRELLGKRVQGEDATPDDPKPRKMSEGGDATPVTPSKKRKESSSEWLAAAGRKYGCVPHLLANLKESNPGTVTCFKTRDVGDDVRHFACCCVRDPDRRLPCRGREGHHQRVRPAGRYKHSCPAVASVEHPERQHSGGPLRSPGPG